MSKYNLGKYDINGKFIEEIILPHEYDLKGLDQFTSEFSTENELKLELYDLKLIDTNDCFLEVVYEWNGKRKKLPIVYKDKKEYLDLTTINSNIYNLKYNEKFLRKLINYYDRYDINYNKIQKLNLNALSYYINIINNLSFEEQKDFEEKFKNFIDNIINPNKVKSYKNIRELGLFIYRFEKQNKLENIKESLKTEQVKRYSNLVDEEGYLGDLEKNYKSGYLEDMEDNDYYNSNIK